MSAKDEDTVMSDGSEDEAAALHRMSVRYRRLSEQRRERGDKEEDSSDGLVDEGDDDGHIIEEEDEEEDIHQDDEEEEDQQQNEDNDDDDDDDDGDDGEEDEEVDNPLLGAFRQLANAHRNGVPASSVIENMARMLPESLMFGGHARGSRLDSYIEAINNRDDPYLVLDTINELSERLLMMNGLDAERGVPHYQLSKTLIAVLNEPMWQEHMELQIVACRCLYNLLEIEPTYCRAAIDCGVIEALQEKLVEISFIDLAEQALQTLEFISRFQGYFLVSKGALSSVLMFLDFFTVHAQRKAVKIIANSVRHVRPSDIQMVEEIFPNLQRIVIELTDSQELESAWSAISLIVKNLRNSSHLEKLVTPELLNKILQVVASSDTNVSTNLKLINTLTICAQNASLSVKIIKTGKIADTLRSILSKYQKNTGSDAISIETLMAIPKDLTLAILQLIAYILPCDPHPVLTVPDKNPKDYSSVQEEYTHFANDIFSLLINIYSATVVFDIRRGVLTCLIRIIASFEDLTKLKERFSIVNLLASSVIQNKGMIRLEKQSINPYIVLLGTLALSNLLITKDPTTFFIEFEREGLLTDTLGLLEILRQDERSKIEAKRSMAEDVFSPDSDDEKNDDDEEEQDVVDDLRVHDEEEHDDEEEDDFMSEDFSDDEPQVIANYTPLFKVFQMEQILRQVTKLASSMEQQYLAIKASGGSKLGHLRLLDELSGDLRDFMTCSTFTEDDWRTIWRNLKDALVQDSYVISSFELISSGIIEVLSSLFNEQRFGSETALARVTFLEIFQDDDAFETLLKKLQESLTRSESFGIIGCGLKTGENRAASLGKQLKIKLLYQSSSDDDDQLFEESMSSFVILVHAIASFNNINMFLKRRIMTPSFFGAISRSSSSSSDWHLEFILDGDVIPLETTIYGALYKHAQSKNPNFDTSRFWNEIHTVQFRKVAGELAYTDMDDKYPNTNEEEFDQLNQTTTIGILNLLKVFYDFHVVDESHFLNFKLTAKLKRQLEEPLIVASGILPNWSIHITRTYPFLFPLETRMFFLQSTSFGYSRLIQLWSSKVEDEEQALLNNNNNNNNAQVSLGRAIRHKVRVSRKHLLKSAFKVLDKLGSHPSILEIEFTDEVGTGLGPTLEFFSDVCHCFVEKSLGLWRDDDGDGGDDDNDDDGSGYVHTLQGLFPAPVALDKSAELEKRTTHFKYLGKFIARALLDNRILDFAFNPVFFEICANEMEQGVSVNLGMEKLKHVDSQLYQSLVNLKKNRESVHEMSINYTLPGYDIELVPHGNEVLVTGETLDEYVDLVVSYTLQTGIKEQVESFVIGFSEVLPYYSMLIFSPHELVQLMGQSDEDWSYETLSSCMHADHGYNIESRTVQNLLKLMMSFSQEERRSFLKFLTGAPRLPIGGFKNLKPEFTVVLKRAENGSSVDGSLPSVMTCANYLKLPDYSSLDVLASKVKRAVDDGTGAFLLS